MTSYLIYQSKVFHYLLEDNKLFTFDPNTIEHRRGYSLILIGKHLGNDNYLKQIGLKKTFPSDLYLFHYHFIDSSLQLKTPSVEGVFSIDTAPIAEILQFKCNFSIPRRIRGMEKDFLSTLSKEDLITIITDYLMPVKKEIENLIMPYSDIVNHLKR